MRWRLLLAAFLLAPPLHAKAGTQSKGYYDFSGGVDTYHSSLSLPEPFVANALNVLFDANAPVVKRQGYTIAFSTKQYQFQTTWSYTDSTNTSWIIVRASDSILASNLAGTIVKISTVSANNLVGEVNALGNAYFVDQTQGVFYWNGTATTYVASSPLGSLISQFHGRVWVAGLAVPNGNQLYGSKYLDGTVWTTGLNPSDPVQFTIGLNDNFDNLTALYPFLDTLYAFKHFSTSALYGFDQTNFQISLITQECGCIDQQSIQTYNHGLNFVSMRGVEFFDGYTCTRKSDPIKNKIDVSIQTQGGANTQSWLQQTQSDWNTGTFSNTGARASLSSIIAPPTLVLSTWTASDTTTANFNAGTLTNVTVGNNTVFLSTNNSGNITNPSFESCTGGGCPGSAGACGAATGWTTSGAGTITDCRAGGTLAGCVDPSPQSGSFMLFCTVTSAGFTLAFEALDKNGNLLQSVSLSNNTSCAWTQATLTPTNANVGKRVSFRVHNFSTSGGNNYLTVNDSYIWGGPISFYYFSSGGSGGALDYGLDNVTLGSSTISTGNFVSRSFDTGVNQSYVTPTAGWTASDFTPTYVLRDSADNVAFTDVLASTGSSVLVRRYVDYVSTLTVTGSQNALSTFNSASFSDTTSSGVFTSACHGSSNMSSFGNFNVTQTLTSGGNILYNVCTSPNSNCSSASCVATTANTQITAPINNFVQVIATVTATATTSAPALNSFTVNWFSGTRSAPMASAIWDNRYWIAITTDTNDTTNDAVIVLNQKGAWSIFDIRAGGFTQYKGSLYHSDSTASGNVYLDNQGYADNGNAINAFIRTKDYAAGALGDDAYFDSMYPSMDNLGNYNIGVTYYLDRNYTSGFALTTLNQTEFASNASIKVPFLVGSNQNFGKTITYLFSATDLNEPWNFYGFQHFYHVRPVQ